MRPRKGGLRRDENFWLRLYYSHQRAVFASLWALFLTSYGWFVSNDSSAVSKFLSRFSVQCMQSAILFYQFCLSVRLSNAGTVSKWTDIIVTLFPLSNKDISLLFKAQRQLQNSKGNPSAGHLNIRGWWKILHIMTFISQTVRDRSTVTTDH